MTSSTEFFKCTSDFTVRDIPYEVRSTVAGVSTSNIFGDQRFEHVPCDQAIQFFRSLSKARSDESERGSSYTIYDLRLQVEGKGVSRKFDYFLAASFKEKFKSRPCAASPLYAAAITELHNHGGISKDIVSRPSDQWS